MKHSNHPKSKEITAKCNCGNIFILRSTMCKDLKLDICSLCHPFYTGKQRIVDTAGRVESFNKRFGSIKIKKI